MLLKLILPTTIFSSSKAERATCSDSTSAIDNADGWENSPALRVVAKLAPLFVARRLFGVTKLLSSRLNWHLFSNNRINLSSINKP